MQVPLKRTRLDVVVGVLIGVVTLILYWRMTGYGFTNVDDQDYITKNPHVTAGLTWPGTAWAFQSGDAGNWHPLTWLSHMVDCQLYGLNAGGHHLTNLFFHIANTLLLFVWLRRATGARWRSVFVAALFAWHPLHVESVAWASERKDVLSTFFWLLALIAYLRYARSPSSTKYGLTLLLFACGLMSKPMVVTFPFVLLLIDYWPLDRLRVTGRGAVGNEMKSEAKNASPQDPLVATPIRSVKYLVLEKVPFFALALASSIVTYQVQNAVGTVSSFENIGLYSRLTNALLAYAKYIVKTLWPIDLSPIYPLAKTLPGGQLIAASLILILLSAWFVFRAKRHPYLVTGWFWFLGTLVPTIGLVQVGAQSMADRYMYIPSIGLFILVVWGLDAVWRFSPQRRRILAAVGILSLAGCLTGTWFQLEYWENPVKLFRHAVELDKDNYIAYDFLGKSLEDKGWKELALSCYSEAVRLQPGFVEGQYNLGTLLMEEGKLDEAITHLQAAVAADPKCAKGHNNLGSALFKRGRISDAKTHFSKAIALRPKEPSAHYNLGTLMLAESQLDEAVGQFSEAVRLRPDFSDAHLNLALAFVRQGKPGAASTHFAEVVRLQPENPEARFNLGLALLEQHKAEAAAAQFSECLRLKPGKIEAHFRLAQSLARQGKSAQAVLHYRESLRLTPDFPEALNELSWILSTSPDAGLRDGNEAIRLAEHACELTKRELPDMLVTLAAAYAEAGRFSNAVMTAQSAEAIESQSGHTQNVERASRLVRLFQAGRPFRE